MTDETLHLVLYVHFVSLWKRWTNKDQESWSRSRFAERMRGPLVLSSREAPAHNSLPRGNAKKPFTRSIPLSKSLSVITFPHSQKRMRTHALQLCSRPSLHASGKIRGPWAHERLGHNEIGPVLISSDVACMKDPPADSLLSHAASLAACSGSLCDPSRCRQAPNFPLYPAVVAAVKGWKE